MSSYFFKKIVNKKNFTKKSVERRSEVLKAAYKETMFGTSEA